MPASLPGQGDRMHRKPTLLFVFVGSLLLRLGERTLLALLFQDPPRSTRLPIPPQIKPAFRVTDL